MSDDDLLFRSRICKMSRPVQDEDGRVMYQHNERLSQGERVKLAVGGQEGYVVTEGLIDLFSRREMVEVLVTHDDGTQEWILLAEQAVYRT